MSNTRDNKVQILPITSHEFFLRYRDDFDHVGEVEDMLDTLSEIIDDVTDGCIINQRLNQNFYLNAPTEYRNDITRLLVGQNIITVETGMDMIQ